MQTSSRPSSRQFAIPGKPEAGLAEWTERIKAMQRQVDADEEEEHRRLEDEIRASRLARARRSAQSRSGTPSSPSPYQRERSLSPAPDEPVRQREQADALLKLTGGGPPSSSSSSRKPEPTSLAAFIGGRATGPRLNKHAPQIDAHDPTLFDQRRIDSGSKPHPVFGRGGVAMPGLANKGRTRTEPIPEVEHDTVPIPVDDALPANGRSNSHDHSHGHVESSQTPKRERKNSNALKRYIDHVDQRTGKPEPIRTRTMSTPASPVIARAPAPPISPSLSSKPSTAFASTSLRSASANMAPTPAFPTSPTAVSASTSTSPAPKSPAYSKPSLSASASPKARASTAPTPAPVSPKPKPKPPHLGSNNSSPKAVVTPSLARPIQPAPKPSPFAPQTPPSVQPSPAFLRAQHNGPKDLTPSLTRLKGRGFVQSIVQASSQLSGQSSQPDELGQIQGGGSGGKKLSSVVDRWKTVETESEPAAPPPKKSFRKSWTAEASTPVHKSVESELAPVAPPPKKALRKSWTAEVPVVAPVQDKVVNRVPFTASLEREDEETEPSWKEIEEEARKVDRKTSATSLRDKASGPSLHKKSSSGVLRKKPSSGALRKKSSSSALRKKSSAASLRAPEADDDAGMRPPSPGGRPMGSSSTMFSYIKPMKTGDDASQSAAHSRPTTPGLGKARSDVGGLPPSGTPLSHLTKDRAKRPKKGGVAGPRDKNEVSPSSRQADVQPRPPPKQQQQPQQPQQPRLQQQIAFPSLVGDAPQPEASKRPSIADRRAGQAVLGVKAVEQQPTPPPVPEKDRKGMVGARALPGLAIAPTPSTSSSTASSAAPSPSPRPHRRRERIPSTGNRATVMDVALIMHEREASLSSQSRGSPSPTMPSPSTGPPSPLPTLEPPERAPAMERRRSSYSSFNSLPPVSEVRTPAPTLPRKAPPPVEEDVPPVPVLPASAPVAVAPPVPEKVLFPIAEPVVEKKEPEVMLIRHKDGPLPSFDVGPLVAAAERSRVHVQSNNISTISVEVLSIVGASANALPPAEAVVFYEGETLAVIHRFKTRASGLVATKVWCWRGKGAATGELEEAKLEGLARRYAAPLLNVRQAAEPAELVYVLGGRIAIRQGFRSLWSAENTTMHCVRLVDGNIIMDELDLAVSNMCSGFSYCVTLLGSSYVWHGRGSLPQEREAALVYARALAADGASIVELVEDESDDDEMFWMMLGEREYARADYWRWRCRGSEAPAPAVWAVDATNAKAPLTAVSSAINQASTHDSVYLIYCTWELFVLVGKDARGKRADLRLALAAAQAMSSRMAGSRPFDPPVHIVILPSQIPQDLRFHLRGLDEDLLNDGDTPDHMNLLSLNEALNHLEKVTWTKLELRYPDMLPLGLDITHIPS